MLTFDPKTIKRILRYLFFVVLIAWVLMSIYILYQYVWFSSEKTSTKGGTFVEGIFDSTSYLPYLRNDLQSKFYQGFLFNACLKYHVDQQGERYENDLCDVKSTDNKTFTLSLREQGAIWSDGTPLTLDDIMFTYQDLIIKNIWNIKNLKIYKDVTLQNEGNTIKISFPGPSVDNKLFFTYNVLPKHVLQGKDLQYYREYFALQPVYTNCANIVSQNTDPYSLIFNLVNCKDTNLNFYQIKNLGSFDSFKTSLQGGKDSIIDAYVGEDPINDYERQQLLTNKIVTIFFNTTSPKLYVRARRSLGGLIKHNFYTTGYNYYVVKNTEELFDAFVSTGENIKEFVGRLYDDSVVNAQDLLDSGIKELPKELKIKGEGENMVYISKTNKPGALPITFGLQYDKITVNHDNKDSIHYQKDKRITYTLGTLSSSGINKYEFWGHKGDKKAKLLTLNIYNTQDTPKSTTNTEQIKIIYHNIPLYKFIADRLEKIFVDAGVQQHFSFEAIDLPEDIETRLLAGDYDILITTIDMGLRKDMTKLFATDDAKSNPSQYKNTKLISLLQQYNSSQGNNRVLNEINSLYSKDMPFVILGKLFVPINVKSKLVNNLFGTGSDTSQDLYEYNRREIIYKDLKLVSNVHIDGKRIRNYVNFSLFLNKALELKKKLSSSDEYEGIPVEELLSGYTLPTTLPNNE